MKGLPVGKLYKSGLPMGAPRLLVNADRRWRTVSSHACEFHCKKHRVFLLGSQSARRASCVVEIKLPDLHSP